MTTMPHPQPEPDLLARIQAAAGCDEAVARDAFHSAAGDLTKAISCALLQSAQYLLLVIVFEETGRGGSTEGILLSFFDLQHLRPRYVKALMSTNALGALSGASAATPSGWAEVVRGYTGGATSYDRLMEQQLESHMGLETLPVPLVDLLAAPKTSIQPYGPRDGALCDQERELIFGLEAIIAKKLSFPFHCKTAWYALPGPDYFALQQLTGWPLPLPAAAAVEEIAADAAARKTGANLETTMHVRGTFLIDSAGGLVLNDLEAGDQLLVKITDQSPLAKVMGEQLGLLQHGDWQPTWGVVTGVEYTAGDNLRVSVAIAQQVTVEVTGLATMRVKAQLHPNHQLTSASSRAGAGLPLPVILFIGALVMGGVLLLLMSMGSS